MNAWFAVIAFTSLIKSAFKEKVSTISFGLVSIPYLLYFVFVQLPMLNGPGVSLRQELFLSLI